MDLVRSLPLGEALGGVALLGDYLAGRSQATSHFSHPFAAEAAFGDAAQEKAGQTFRADRAALADALARQNEAFSNSPAVREAIAALRRPEALAVVTGQQPGLLTGPVYTVYKAISAVAFARRLGAELEAPCIPVFWMETDDTDRGEVDWAAVFDGSGTPARIALEVPSEWEGRPVGGYALDDRPQAVLKALDQALPDSDFKGSVLDWVRSAAAGSSDLAGWFGRLMASLFAEQGLVMLDVNDQAIKELTAPVFEFAIEQPLAATESAMGEAATLNEQGYRPQVHKDAEAAAFFLIEGGRRRHVGYREGAFEINGARRTPAELKRRLAERPNVFDCNVLLRPVAQDYLLPTVAYVAGPHEIAYFAQLRGLYRAAGIAMPVIVPRASASLVPRSVARLMEKYDLGLDSLRGDRDAVLTRLARERHGDEVTERFAAARSQAEALADDLQRVAGEVDPSLAESAINTRTRFLREVERLEEKALKALRRQDEEFAARVAHAQAMLLPGGEMQERVINITSFLARRGMGLMEELRDALAGAEGRHLVLSW